jgi:Fe-S cluster assembly iron-binding protein IscA
MTVKLEVTEEAKNQVRQLIKSQAPGTAVRIFLAAPHGGGGGGCGCGAKDAGSAPRGPAFGMAFDRPRSGDEVVPVDGFSIIVDQLSAESIDGARVDFVQGLDATGFKIVAPHQPASEKPIGSGCGCC